MARPSDDVAAWVPAGTGKRGGQQKFSDLAVETALTLRLILHLPLRQTEGFLRSILQMMGLNLPAPDHTTLSRRGRHLSIELYPDEWRRGMDFIVASTGLIIVGEGEWVASASPGRAHSVPLQADHRAGDACSRSGWAGGRDEAGVRHTHQGDCPRAARVLRGRELREGRVRRSLVVSRFMHQRRAAAPGDTDQTQRHDGGHELAATQPALQRVRGSWPHG